MSATPATQIKVVAQTDLGPEFTYTGGKLHVAVGPSTDTANVAATAGSDGKVSVTAAAIKTNQITYSLSVDGTNKLVKLTGSDGSSTSVSTQTIEATINNLNVNGSVVKFVDAVTPTNTLNVDFSTFLTTLMKANSNSTSTTGDGKTTPFTVNVNIDPVTGNILKLGTAGLSVNTSDILAILNANIVHTFSSSVNTMTSTVNGVTVSAPIVNSHTVSSAANTLTSAVNGVTSTTPIINSNTLINNAATTGNIENTTNGVLAGAKAVTFTDLAGNTLGSAFA
jgi:hypothetical protein